ncbi:hypothetical protein P3T24_007500 [Paraburkholderia sp. GAS33]|jgi:hypothetical protein
MVASMCIAGGSRSLREVSDARVLLRVLLKQTSKVVTNFDLRCGLRWRHV